jgi:predicted transcriptional regulator
VSHHRDRIREAVATDPGIHFNALTRRLDLAPGQVQYHLKRLDDADEVVEEQLYGRTHYYTPEYGVWEREAIAVLRRETARDVVFCLLAGDHDTPAAVADELAIARSTMEWHLDHLVEQDLLVKERDANNRVTLVLTKPEETAAMLDEIEPSVPERFVDRFTRLVDGFLDDASRSS